MPRKYKMKTDLSSLTSHFFLSLIGQYEMGHITTLPLSKHLAFPRPYGADSARIPNVGGE
jgi:hypothetical protein